MTNIKEKITSKTTKTILFASMIAAMVLPFSSMEVADAAPKAPDFTDYVSQYRDVDTIIRENQKIIESDQNALKDNARLSSAESAAIEKRIIDKKEENDRLWKQLDEIERLNIESYILDDTTQAIFDDALETLTDNYLNTNGVYDIFPNNKHRKMIVVIDPDDFANSGYEKGQEAFTAELNDAVGVNVETIFEKLVLTSHATSCTSPTGPCNPDKGGISVSHQGSTGYGNTIGFKALHQNYGYGFIIAKHEVPNGNEQVVQPKSSSNIIGVTQAIGGQYCDCAFIQLSGGHSMVDSIWAPDLGSIYPVQSRNTSFTPAGTMLTWDGLGSSAHIGEVISETSNTGRLDAGSSPGDSGAAIFKPQANGNADVYGIAVSSIGSVTYYEPYDYIESQLGLQW